MTLLSTSAGFVTRLKIKRVHQYEICETVGGGELQEKQRDTRWIGKHPLHDNEKARMSVVTCEGNDDHLSLASAAQS